MTHSRNWFALPELAYGALGQGQDVTMDFFHYPYSSTRLLILIPEWVLNRGTEKLKEVVRSEVLRPSEGRELLREEIRTCSGSFTELMLTNIKQPHNRKYEYRPLSEVSDTTEKGQVDAICDLPLDDDLQISHVPPGFSLTTLPSFITTPWPGSAPIQFS